MNSDPKKLTPRSKPYIEWLKKQPCSYPGCGRTTNEYMSVVPAHQSLDGRGTGIKPSDFYALPLCSEHHVVFEHQKGSKTFWKDIDKKKLIIDHLIKYIREGKQQ